MTGQVGTMRYMIPECCLKQQYGLECDICSWSIVAYEIFTKQIPFEDMTPDMYKTLVCIGGYRLPIVVQTNSYNYSDDNDDADADDDAMTLLPFTNDDDVSQLLPPVLPLEYKILLQQTWTSNPSQRLFFVQIKEQLDLFLQKEKLLYELYYTSRKEGI
mmetsp:Transcript_33163/g.37275  ORF Transcript_33163/g.37275 Transcript_33163/m.37275 type:complete len:159 (-) Transcript_33163:219-695(-)